MMFKLENGGLYSLLSRRNRGPSLFGLSFRAVARAVKSFSHLLAHAWRNLRESFLAKMLRVFLLSTAVMSGLVLGFALTWRLLLPNPSNHTTYEKGIYHVQMDQVER